MARMEVVSIRSIDRTGRHRKQLGDLRTLCQSIEKVGLLHPIVLTNEMKLVAGARRIAAFERHGEAKIPANIVANLDEAASLLQAEQDENTCRLDFTPSEAVAIGKLLEDFERPKAKERLSEAGRMGGKNKGSVNFTDPSRGNTRDKVAAAVGMSGVTYEKAKAVVEAAEKDPETFGPVVEEMDRTGRVSPAFKKIHKRTVVRARGCSEDSYESVRLLKSIENELTELEELMPDAVSVRRIVERCRQLRDRLDKHITKLEKGKK